MRYQIYLFVSVSQEEAGLLQAPLTLTLSQRERGFRTMLWQRDRRLRLHDMTG